MLPHVRDRPLSLMRFPDGIEAEGFFQKNTPDYFPRFIKRVEAEKRGGTVTHAVVDERRRARLPRRPEHDHAARLAVPRRQACASPTGSCSTSTRRPARTSARCGARRGWTGDLLREIGLEPFAQVTGSKGIHVWTPLRRRATFEEVKPVARQAAALLAARHPDELTTEFRKSERGGRILVDVVAQRLRPDGRAALRGPAAAGRAGGHPDRVGRAVGLEAARRSLDGHQRAAPAAVEGRPLGRHRIVRARAVAAASAWTALAAPSGVASAGFAYSRDSG